jgi:hypothetical protein
MNMRLGKSVDGMKIDEVFTASNSYYLSQVVKVQIIKSHHVNYRLVLIVNHQCIERLPLQVVVNVPGLCINGIDEGFTSIYDSLTEEMWN